MYAAHVGVAVLTSLLAIASGVAKLRRDPHVVKVINEVAQVPMRWSDGSGACSRTMLC